LGVIGTALVIIQQIWGPKDASASTNLMSATDLWKGRGANPFYFYWWMLHNSLIVMPILLSVLVTAAARFKQGSKWLLLRAAAESIKREIFRYRTRSMYYKEIAEQQLALKIEDITRRTMRTEVNTSSLKPYDVSKGLPPRMDASHGQDDGISYLVPDRYIELRLDDQLSFFRTKAVKLEKQLKMLYWSTFLVGGLGSYLAAVNMQVWVALTTTVVAAFGTYLGYRQVENTLIKYNQAATDLANVKAWWNALSAEDQSLSANIDSLVSHTEQVLQTELDGWIQQMQNSLAELREDQKKKYEKDTEASANKQEGPTVSPTAAPPVKQVADEEKDGEDVNDKAEINNDVADGAVETEPPNEDKPEVVSSTTTATTDAEQTGNEAAEDDVEPQPSFEDKPKNKEDEIEISSTSSAALIGEI
ncbi:MAG: SLATT domain-containing protein, partial [Segetibacter sp.]